MPFVLEPEVAGGWGKGTVANASVHPPVVEELEYEFSGWLGDELLESFPCFIVSDRIAKALVGSSLTGYRLAAVAISKSAEFLELAPNVRLPGFQWLKVHGSERNDDFWTNTAHQLVVSERALSVLKSGCLTMCKSRSC